MTDWREHTVIADHERLPREKFSKRMARRKFDHCEPDNRRR